MGFKLHALYDAMYFSNIAELQSCPIMYVYLQAYVQLLWVKQFDE